MAMKYEELRMFDRPESMFNQILNSSISEVMEDDKYYYVILQSDDPYANENYVVNKKNKQVWWAHFTDFIAAGVFDEAKEITPEEFRKRVL